MDTSTLTEIIWKQVSTKSSVARSGNQPSLLKEVGSPNYHKMYSAIIRSPRLLVKNYNNTSCFRTLNNVNRQCVGVLIIP